jgi:galactokinase
MSEPVISLPALERRVARGYVRQYGVQPDGVWFAPGRVNLIGEHTDYSEGFVLPFALSSGVAVAAGRQSSAAVTVWSHQASGVGRATAQLNTLTPESISGWAAYPLGVAWALAAAGHHVGGTSIAIDSNLAIGAGLSSSAALECAVALAIAELHGLAVSRTELAALASRAENDFAGAPTGIMDQSAALLCRAGHALLVDCRSAAVTDVPLDPAAHGLALLVIDTGVRHDLTDGRYAARRRSCEEAARVLHLASLRDLTDFPDCVVPEAVSKLANPVLRRRARHVGTENQRVLAVARMLRRGALAEVGPLLTESHVSLRDDFEVSWPQADAAVETAMTAGAIGARMVGGGFGGSVIALVPADAVIAVRAATAAAFSRSGWAPDSVFAAVPSDSGRRLR